MPNEIELKLRIAKADVPRLRRHPALKQHLLAKPLTRKLVSIYYDTPDLKLLDAAISLRVRSMSGGWFQAVKAAGHSLGGLHQRHEWEDLLSKGEPDFDKIIEPHLAEIFASPGLRAALKPMFITNVARTEWQLEYEDGSQIEVALDLGELQVGKEKAPIQEVELELKHGKAIHLFELALALQADIPLHIENISKAQYGYAYFRPSPPRVSLAHTPELKAKTSVQEAALIIIRECLRHLQSNQEMVLHGTDAEGVHQMHIAMRRLRSALKLFKLKAAFLSNELDWISLLLGTARDWDVLLNETLPAALHQLAPNESHFMLQAHATSTQKQAQQALKQALTSQRYQRLLLSLGAWLETESAIESNSNSVKKIGKFAKNNLNKSYEKLQASGKTLHDLNKRQLHKVRIKAKNLRYALEFFVQALESKESGDHLPAFIAKLALVQKSLGLRNDIAITEQLMAQLMLQSRDADLNDAISVLNLWNQSRLAKTDKLVRRSWRAFRQARPCWD
ncbi:MAG: CHAD domain-containing protein [Methylophilaceae bacterium]|nr:CHAD domain-containing protein [Methylophilaceae bacterium]